MAGDRKIEVDHSTLGAVPIPDPTGNSAGGHLGAEVADRSSSLHCFSCNARSRRPPDSQPCQQQLLTQHPTPPKMPPTSPQVSSPLFPSGSIPFLDVPSDLYSQSASLYNQLQEQDPSLLPQWWLSSLSNAELASICAPSQTPTQRALGMAPFIMGTQGDIRDHYAVLAQQSMMYAAEQERQRQQLAAGLQAIAAGSGFTQAEMGSGPRPPFLRDPSVGFGSAAAQFDGET